MKRRRIVDLIKILLDYRYIRTFFYREFKIILVLLL